MKIGVYVGSFDPVHLGHKHIVDYLLKNNLLDKVVIIPTGNYWHKNNLTPLNHRINMLKYYENNKIIVNDKYNNLEYTYLILNNLKKDYKECELYLIIGADNLTNFHMWKEIDEVLDNKILVLPRNNVNVYEYINKFKQKDKFVVVNGFNEIDISSTFIREKICNKEYNYLTNYVDKEILNYIINNKIYEGD